MTIDPKAIERINKAFIEVGKAAETLATSLRVAICKAVKESQDKEKMSKVTTAMTEQQKMDKAIIEIKQAMLVAGKEIEQGTVETMQELKEKYKNLKIGGQL